MAITRVSYELLKEHRDYLPRGGSLLEIGEANWYGDAPASLLMEDIHDTVLEKMARTANRNRDLFALAKVAYAVVFDPNTIHSVDFNGTSAAIRHDLNRAFPGEARRYNVVINNGTAEHIFNIAQLFKTIHDSTAPSDGSMLPDEPTACGGIMIHDCPFTGWVDHGFYTLQPTLFYDLAHANGYDLISLAITHFQSGTIIRVKSREELHALEDIPDNSMLFVVMRKVHDAPFRVPMQGVYDGRLSEEGARAWQERR